MPTFIRTGTDKPTVGFLIPDNPAECWEWQGGCDPAGYGQAWNPRNNRLDKAHRMVWEWINNTALPARGSGYELDHTCRNRKCVIHLELVTVAANRASRNFDHLRRDIPHGTVGGYVNHKCRCCECRKRWSGYMRERRYQAKCRTALAAVLHTPAKVAVI